MNNEETKLGPNLLKLIHIGNRNSKYADPIKPLYFSETIDGKDQHFDQNDLDFTKNYTPTNSLIHFFTYSYIDNGQVYQYSCLSILGTFYN